MLLLLKVTDEPAGAAVTIANAGSSAAAVVEDAAADEEYLTVASDPQAGAAADDEYLSVTAGLSTAVAEAYSEDSDGGIDL